ncbi:hypothetical protein IFO69_13645 [Echinicola sp. CAU 1574]|uniref:Protein disulfide isomerase n=1 Tax=Echinicola arenosa TaxID=2774144 RepID=A0ABR9ALX6_9BACT|nr:hypothetical protein [Echinicola arenosa]MBD8489796.1 hypothetical protein [Echinicola arenosa]
MFSNYIRPILVFLIFGIFSCNNGKSPIIYPEGLEFLSLENTSDSICMTCGNQILIYHNFDESSLYIFSPKFQWAELKRKYPDVGIVSVFEGNDKEFLIKELTKLEYPWPVFYDKNRQFFSLNKFDTVDKKNKNFIPFHLKNGTAIDYAEVGVFPYLEEELNKILKVED